MQLSKLALGAALSIVLASSSAVTAHAEEPFDYTSRSFTLNAPRTPSDAAVDFKVLAVTARSLTVSWSASAFAPELTPVQREGEVNSLTSFGYANGCTFTINASSIIATQPNSTAKDFAYTRNVWPTSAGTQVTTLDVSPGMTGSVQLDCFTYYDSKSVNEDGTVESRRGAYELPGYWESAEITTPDVAPLKPSIGDKGGFLNTNDGNLYFGASVKLVGSGSITQAQYIVYRNGVEIRNRVKPAVESANEDWYYNENFPPTMLTGTYSAKVRFSNSAGWGPWSAIENIASIKTPQAAPEEESAPDADDIAAAKKTLASKLVLKASYLNSKVFGIKWSAPSVKWTKISYMKVGDKKALHVQKVSAKTRSASWKSAKLSKHGTYYVKLSALTKQGKALNVTGAKVKVQ